ncbi:rhomboid family intramembrane serine protease [Corynebacterium sp. Marseille-Q3615]|uniref:Rhomboid family intramembrane serine protease n=1 Tax=Corynebacterium haemomassiliense TaxID=2754726 RepID=A0A7W2EAW2_9CORY|nr:rhomboid family intramembrane serine protease [Corynebacterium haemomassiliense]
MSEHNHTPEGWGYGQTGQPGYGKPFQRPFSHPERQQPAFGEPAQPYNPYATPQQQGQYGQPVQFGQPQYNQTPGTKRVSKRKAQRQTGLKLAGGFLATIWVVFILELVFPWLQAFGIHPLDVSSLPFIFTSPLLHANLEHIISNSIPGAIFAFLVGYSGKRVFWEVTTFVVIIGGLGTWLLGGVGTNHIGASGLVYGWLAYLIIRGFFNRSISQIITGLILGFFYSGLIFGLLPGTEGVSWQAHLFGTIGGLVAGMVITSDDPPELVAKREAKARSLQNPGQR